MYAGQRQVECGRVGAVRTGAVANAQCAGVRTDGDARFFCLGCGKGNAPALPGGGAEQRDDADVSCFALHLFAQLIMLAGDQQYLLYFQQVRAEGGAFRMRIQEAVVAHLLKGCSLPQLVDARHQRQ